MARKTKWTREDLKPLSLSDKPASFAVQFCDEDCENGWEAVLQAIRDTDPDYLQIIAICHDRDSSVPEECLWPPSSVRRHFHVVIRGGSPAIKPRVGATLKNLGIAFRPEDNWMRDAHGIEAAGKLSGYIAFLLHGNGYTSDGEVPYKVSELVSNLPEEKMEAICGLALGGSVGELDTETVARLRGEARDLGRMFDNFDEWYDELPYDPDKKEKRMKDLRKSYDLGVMDRYKESEEVVRLSVFITGPHGTGKSTAAAMAVNVKNDRILRVGGGGRGRFDNLKPWTQAIIVDDDVSPGLLNLADNRITSPYSRFKNNLWTGAYFIVTSNLSFDKWATKCGVDIDQLAAARDRFYICSIKGEGADRQLIFESESHRGNERIERERFEMFWNFLNNFNDALRSYDPKASIDYEAYKDPAFRKVDAQRWIDSPAFWEQVEKFLAFFGRTPVCGMNLMNARWSTSGSLPTIKSKVLQTKPVSAELPKYSQKRRCFGVYWRRMPGSATRMIMTLNRAYRRRKMVMSSRTRRQRKMVMSNRACRRRKMTANESRGTTGDIAASSGAL